MKKQIITFAACAALSWSVTAQPDGTSSPPPEPTSAYGNSGWTPGMAYGDPAPGERGRTAARIAAEQRELARLREERRLLERERLAIERQRERERLQLLERDRQRARFDAEERERQLSRERQAQRERLIARERQREREIARQRGWDWDGSPRGRSRYRDRDGDGVANRMDRAPDDPRFY